MRPSRPSPKQTQDDTSWGKVAGWYHQHVSGSEDTYHEKVVKPNLLRSLGEVRGKKVLDMACGEGFFSRALCERGAKVTGVDIAPELISIAKKRSDPAIMYRVMSADKMTFPAASFDAAVCVLALQNIKDLSGALRSASKALKPGGEFVAVLNHPCFRIPELSAWEFDEKKHIQYRRLDGYLSESSTAIRMHPGSDPRVTTPSFHRPLQLYMKEFAKHGFVLAGLEEWISHRQSQKGPRAVAEDRARKEFPLFLMLKVVKLK